MDLSAILIAAAGLAISAVTGRRQLLRWDIYDRKNQMILAIWILVMFVPGYYLMSLYGYHILKIFRYWVLMYGLMLAALIDMKRKIIPNKTLLFLAGVRTILLVGELACFPGLWLELILSSVVGLGGGGLLFLLAGAVSRKGLGMGDVKMIAVMGYYLGFQVLMSDLIITLSLTVAAGAALLVTRRGSLHSEMPFAPFAAAGTMITILMGF